MGKGELKAVDDVSFDIKKGEVFGLVGESGCGKTTTGRSIIKLYDITGGNVYFKGKRIAASSALIGSSAIISSGFIIIERAIPILCLCPPENSCGYLPACSLTKPTISNT